MGKSTVFLCLCVLLVMGCKRNASMRQDIKEAAPLSNVAKSANGVIEKQRYASRDYSGLMLLYSKGRYVYITGDIVPNSNGWTVRFPLYRLDVQTLEVKHIGSFAAIRFEDGGFKAAVARLVNPDATCTADESYAIHDVFFNNAGRQTGESKTEYGYDELERIYTDSLVSAVGFRYRL